MIIHSLAQNHLEFIKVLVGHLGHQSGLNYHQALEMNLGFHLVEPLLPYKV